MEKISKTQVIILGFLLVVFMIIGYFIALPYSLAIILAIILALVFEPLYLKLQKIFVYKGLASFVTTLIVLFIFLIPLVFAGTLVFNEAQQLYISTIKQGNISGASGLLDFINNKANDLLPSTWGAWNVDKYITQVLEWLVQNLGSIFSSLARGVLTFAFSLFILFYLLKDSVSITDYISKHGPLSKKYTEVIFDKIKNSINSVVRGSLVVAVLQGVATGVGFAIFGIPNPALWGGIATIAALVPTLGTSLVIIPAIFYSGLTNPLWQTIGILIWGVIFVGLLDNFVRPQLVRRGAGLHPLLVLIGVLGGVSVFGPIGFVLGPVIFSIIFVLIDIFSEVWRGETNQ